MRTRGYGDLVARLIGLPSRGWCALVHGWWRESWKPWALVDSRHGARLTRYRCRQCGREFIRPRAW